MRRTDNLISTGGFRRLRSLTVAALAVCLPGLLLGATGCAERDNKVREQTSRTWDAYRAAVKSELASDELRSGNTEQALELAREAGALSPDNPAHAALLARTYLARADFGAARRILELALGARPDEANLHYLLGIVHERDARWLLARDCYGRAAELEPANLDYLVATATAAAKVDGPDAALELLGAHGEAFDDQPVYHAARAELARSAGRLPDACAAYERVLALGAGDRSTRESLALLYHMLGRDADALTYLTSLRLDAQQASLPLALAYARSLLSTQQAVSALDWLSAVAQRHPEHAEVWLLTAQARVACGDWDRAIESGQRAAVLSPRSPDAHTLLAALYLSRGDVAAAATAAAAAVDCDPRNATAYSLLGRAYERRGDRGTALEMYRTAVRLAPDQPLAIELLRQAEH